MCVCASTRMRELGGSGGVVQLLAVVEASESFSVAPNLAQQDKVLLFAPRLFALHPPHPPHPLPPTTITTSTVSFSSFSLFFDSYAVAVPDEMLSESLQQNLNVEFGVV